MRPPDIDPRDLARKAGPTWRFTLFSSGYSMGDLLLDLAEGWDRTEQEVDRLRSLPLDLHPCLVRPGPEPTHDDPAGGRRWHYLTKDGRKTELPTFLYEHVSGGWGGECDGWIFPDGHSPAGPATREHIEARIEARLLALHVRVVVRDGDRRWSPAEPHREEVPHA